MLLVEERDFHSGSGVVPLRCLRERDNDSVRGSFEDDIIHTKIQGDFVQSTDLPYHLLRD